MKLNLLINILSLLLFFGCSSPEAEVKVNEKIVESTEVYVEETEEKPIATKLTAQSEETDKNPTVIPEEEEKSEARRIKVFATGDILYHLDLYNHKYDEELGEHDFSHFYALVEDKIKEGDIVIGNYETSINPAEELSCYPRFNTPPEAIKYLKQSGFNVLSTANNHCLDRGLEGLDGTIDAMETHGVYQFGTYKDERKPLIVEKNGIKVGFISYSEYFNGLSSWADERPDSISPLEEELVLEEITEMKELGVDFLIAYPHWGTEYTREPSDSQIYFKNLMIDNGVDAVLGSHPHILQPVVIDERDGNQIFSIYSMGNSISHQRAQSSEHPGVETGVFIELDLVKENGQTKLEDYQVHLTYVNLTTDEFGNYHAETVFYEDIIEGGKYRDRLDPYTQEVVDEQYQINLDALQLPQI